MPLTMEPVDSCSNFERGARPSALRVSCCRCGKTFAGGVVVTDPREMYEWFSLNTQLQGLYDDGITAALEAGCGAAFRFFYCDGCTRVQAWAEARFDGALTGAVLAGAIHVMKKDFAPMFHERFKQSKGCEQ